MSGASFAHNFITVNIATHLNIQLMNGECRVATSDMRVKVPQTDSYFYPDVVVVCGEPRAEDDTFDTLLNPILIVEVLSPSTEVYDRREKFEHYQQIVSLKEYVLISQDKVRVEHYRRQETGWMQTEFQGLEEVLPLLSIGCELHCRISTDASRSLRVNPKSLKQRQKPHKKLFARDTKISYNNWMRLFR